MRRFVAVWAASLLLITLAAAGFNRWVDPYLYFGTPAVTGGDAQKPHTAALTALAKAWLLPRARPVTLILGTSKADIGIDPDSPLWPGPMRPVFNDGVPGQGIDDMLRNLQSALAEAPLRRVLLCLDLAEFMEVPQPVGTDQAWHLRQTADALLSLSALKDSVMSLLARQGMIGMEMSARGGTEAPDLRLAIDQIGADEMFVERLGLSDAVLATIAAALAQHPASPIARLERLREIITLCQSHGIGLDIAITPVHSDYLTLIDQHGLWPRYKAAKRAIVQVVGGQGDVALWDFMGFDDTSTEAIPPPGAHGVPRWYFEPSHFTHALGARTLAAIYQGAAGFGVRLSPQTIEAHLAREDAARADFRAMRLAPAEDRIRRARAVAHQ